MSHRASAPYRPRARSWRLPVRSERSLLDLRRLARHLVHPKNEAGVAHKVLNAAQDEHEAEITRLRVIVDSIKNADVIDIRRSDDPRAAGGPKPTNHLAL